MEAWNRQAIAAAAFVSFAMVGLYATFHRWGLLLDFLIVMGVSVWAAQRPIPRPPPPSDQELGDELNALLSVGREPPKQP